MLFNVLKYFLILILVTRELKGTTSLNSVLATDLNQVSDFNGIVETDREQYTSNQIVREGEPIQVIYNSKISEKNAGEYQENSHEQFDENPSSGGVFSSSLSESDSDSDSLCPKHDIKHRDSDGTPCKFKLVPQEEEVEASDEEISGRLLPKPGNAFETARPIVIKDNPLPTNVNVGNKVTNNEVVTEPQVMNGETVPDYVYDFDNAKENEDSSCENCKTIKGLFPIPLLESILINKLLENNGDMSKPYPIKYIVKTVLPNFKEVNQLDNPQTVNYLKNYLHRRKRQLEYLRKRSNKKAKNKHKKKKHKKKKKPKSRHHRSANEPNSDHQSEINKMVEYIAKNQTFNDTFTYMPLLFGTVSPAENQMLLAGIKQNSSAEEKFMLEKILSLHTERSTTPLHSSETPNSIQVGSVVSALPSTASLSSESSKPNASTTTNQETATYNLNLNMNDPDIRKNFMEIMQRQQNIGSYEGTNRVRRDAVSTSSPGTPSSTLQAGSSGATTNGTLGLVVASPQTAPPINEIPGIIIYPKNPKQHKRFVNGAPEDHSNTLLNQADINNILKSIENSANEKFDASLEVPKYKKDCKSDACKDETDNILDMLHNIKQEGIKSEEGAIIEYSSTTVPNKVKTNVQSLAESKTLVKGLSEEQEKNAIKQNPAIKEKLTKLQKDLKMVDEIQNIFNAVANAKKDHQVNKRALSLHRIPKRKVKEPDTSSKQMRENGKIDGLIQARMWQKRMKNRSDVKDKTSKFGEKRPRRFLALA